MVDGSCRCLQLFFSTPSKLETFFRRRRNWKLAFAPITKIGCFAERENSVRLGFLVVLFPTPEYIKSIPKPRKITYCLVGKKWPQMPLLTSFFLGWVLALFWLGEFVGFIKEYLCVLQH